MLQIRLSRTGKRNQPHYRIVVKEKHSKRDGSFVASLGYYIPYTNPGQLKLDIKEFDTWIGKGAQPSDTVRYLRTKATTEDLVSLPKSKKQKHAKKRKVSEPAAEVQEATTAEATPVATS